MTDLKSLGMVPNLVVASYKEKDLSKNLVFASESHILVMNGDL